MLNRQPFHISIISAIENATGSDFRFVIGPLLMRTTIPTEGYDGIIKAIRARTVAMLWDSHMVASIVSALEHAHQVDKEAEDTRRREAEQEAELRRRNTEHHNS